MTIKRRLSISNILMIALPIALFLIFCTLMSFMLIRVVGTLDGDTNEMTFLAENSEYVPLFIAAAVFMLLLMIAAIFFTNRMLTRRVVKSVTTPLDTLSYGVGQITGGNLSFRLDYLGKDEFSPVCAAFNEMAERLQKSEESRRKDEESRRELIAGISHDLRTPLTSIKAYVEGIEKGVAQTPEQQKKYLDTIKGKTADLENIINKLFLFSKLDTNDFPVNMETADIGGLIVEMVEGLTEEYQNKGLRFVMERSLSPAFVRIDKTLLQNVILNILENSAKYKTAEIGIVSVVCTTENGYAKIRLSDNGGGVSEDAIPKLFDVFYRADPSRGANGNGLGLAISAKIIKQMGGKISAETTNGGLAINIDLPLVAEEGVNEKNSCH
jgi:signal transduction histidine kinase